MTLKKNFLRVVLFFAFFLLFSCNNQEVEIPTYPIQKQINPNYYNRYPLNYNPRSRYYNRPYNVKQPSYRGYYQDYDYYYAPPYGYNYESDNANNNKTMLDKQ